MLRVTLAAAVLAACGQVETVATENPDPLDAVWSDSLHAGDLIVLVPGTGAYDYLAATIEPLAGDRPLVDVRAFTKVADDAIVFEQAIGAARRAGISDDELEHGAVTFALWGAGFKRLHAFDYVSYEGLTIPIQILGGTNSVASGRVIDNLAGYTTDAADRDATSLYTLAQAWTIGHPAANIMIASHSWGGAVAEWLAFHLDTIAAKHGPLAPIRLTVAAGVPGFVPGYMFAGPGLRDINDGALYEIDRPDDPVHAMNPSGNPDGHQYDILLGDKYHGEFRGAYGVTTREITCIGTPGACALPPR